MDDRCLRKRPWGSYYEQDEPKLDEYIFCEQCGDIVFEYCSIHGPLLVIPDNKVHDRRDIPWYVPHAALTVPKEFLHIAPSSIPGAGLGLFASKTLPSGVRFGPYVGERRDTVDSNYCWQIHDDRRKPLYYIDAADASGSNWMRYVNCARHWTEQNLVAFQYKEDIYYRTIKVIPRFTELLIFYGSEFANELDIHLGQYNAPLNTPNLDYTKNNLTKENENTLSRPNNITCNTINTPLAQTEIPFNKSLETVEDNVMNHALLEPIQKKNKTLRNNDNLYNCEFCVKPFYNRNHLERHLKLHDPNRKHVCVICNLKYTEASNLKKHILTHSREKSYNCYICRSKFSNEDDLRTHLLEHNIVFLKTGQKLHFCQICNKKFTKGSILKVHSRTHTGEKPFSCDICFMRFPQSHSVKRHKKLVHHIVI